jgi:hypothetical protein
MTSFVFGKANSRFMPLLVLRRLLNSAFFDSSIAFAVDQSSRHQGLGALPRFSGSSSAAREQACCAVLLAHVEVVFSWGQWES